MIINTDIKLKHLDLIMDPKGVTPFEILGFKNTLINRLRYKKQLYILSYNLKEFLNTVAQDVEYRKCALQMPRTIDHISFKQMLSLNAFNSKGSTPTEAIAKKIAIVVCDTNGISEKEAFWRALNLSFKEAMGMFNKITADHKASQLMWEKRFMSVNVPDNDYDAAGGHAMNQFSVITNIKQVCTDFNVSITEAWEQSYSIVQSNSYSKATAAHVQWNMEQIKEAQMMAKRKNKFS